MEVKSMGNEFETMEEMEEMEEMVQKDYDLTTNEEDNDLEDCETVDLHKDIIQYIRLSGKELDIFLEQEVENFKVNPHEAFNHVFEHYYPY